MIACLIISNCQYYPCIESLSQCKFPKNNMVTSWRLASITSPQSPDSAIPSCPKPGSLHSWNFLCWPWEAQKTVIFLDAEDSGPPEMGAFKSQLPSWAEALVHSTVFPESPGTLVTCHFQKHTPQKWPRHLLNHQNRSSNRSSNRKSCTKESHTVATHPHAWRAQTKGQCCGRAPLTSLFPEGMLHCISV